MILLDSFRNVPRPYTVFYTHRDSNLNPNSNSVGALNQEKALLGALLGAFSVIVKTNCATDGSFHSTSHGVLEWSHSNCTETTAAATTVTDCPLHCSVMLAQCCMMPCMNAEQVSWYYIVLHANTDTSWLTVLCNYICSFATSVLITD